jgi:hypothetical protein
VAAPSAARACVGRVLSHLASELSGVALGALLGGTVLALIAGGPASVRGAAILVLMTLTGLGLLEVVRRGLLAGPAVESALDAALGLAVGARSPAQALDHAGGA